MLSSSKNQEKMGSMEKLSKAMELNEGKKNGVQALTLMAIREWKDLDSHSELMKNKFKEGVSEIESREKKLKCVQESVSQITREVDARRLWVEKKMEEFDRKEISMEGLFERMEKGTDLLEKTFEGFSKKLELIQDEIEKRENLQDFEVKKVMKREDGLFLREEKLKKREHDLDYCEKKLEKRENEASFREKNGDTRQNELDLKEEKLKSKDNRLDSREKWLEMREVEADLKEENVHRRESELGIEEKKLKAKDKDLDSREKILEKREKEADLKEKYVKRKQDELGGKENKLMTRDVELDLREKKLEIKEKQAYQRDQNVDQRQHELDVERKKLVRRQNELHDISRDLDSKQSELDRKGKILEIKENELGLKQNNLERMENEIESKEREFEGKANGFRAKQKMCIESILDLELMFLPILEPPEQFNKEPIVDNPKEADVADCRKRFRNLALASRRILDTDEVDGSNLSKRSCNNDKVAAQVTNHDLGESGSSNMDINQVNGLASSTLRNVDVCQSDFDPGALANDIGKEMLENRFNVGETWACLDGKDQMPRAYVQITEVNNKRGNFRLGVAWLKPFPWIPGQAKWLSASLPAGCGTFNLGMTSVESPSIFSHQVYCVEKEGYGYCILPKAGETWAIYKDWDIMARSFHPEKHRQCEYEIVEILSCCGNEFFSGIKVAYLNKMEGRVKSYWQRSLNENDSFTVKPYDFYRFSHKVISAQMNSNDAVGCQDGTFEIEPEFLPPGL